MADFVFGNFSLGNFSLPVEIIANILITALSIPPALCILSPNLCFLNMLRPQLPDQQQQPFQQQPPQQPQEPPDVLPPVLRIPGTTLFTLSLRICTVIVRSKMMQHFQCISYSAVTIVKSCRENNVHYSIRQFENFSPIKKQKMFGRFF